MSSHSTTAAPTAAPTADEQLGRAARHAWSALETLHVLGYFAPQVTAGYVGLGLHPRLSYFPARAAAFGPVGPEVPAATFYVFAPWLLEKALPSAWEVTSPEQVQATRRRGVGEVLEQVLADIDVTELLELARTACEGLTAPGRALYAAHAGLDWPREPRLALWHAATLIREHRGDGHVAVLLRAGLDPVESMVLGGLFSGNTTFLKETRGWTEQEWQAAEERLTARGLVAAGPESGPVQDERDEDGPDEGGPDVRAVGLTAAGTEFRKQLERETDTLALEGWRHLGPDGTRRVVELGMPLRERALASGLLPEWITGRG